jgi:hypothetical protein
VAIPDAVTPVAGAMVPAVAPNETGMPSGTCPSAGVSVPALFIVRSATTVAVPPGRTEVGEAVTWSTSQGSKVTGPLTVSLPAPPGPPLLPHQLLVASTVAVVALSRPTALSTTRLKWAVASAVLGAPDWTSRLMPAPATLSPPLPLSVMLLLTRVAWASAVTGLPN